MEHFDFFALQTIWTKLCSTWNISGGIKMLKKIFEPIQQKNAVRDIPIGRIKTSPYQPRTDFVSNDISSLAKSISQLGLLQPITVREHNGFELVCGERRLRAAKLAGLEVVPCLVAKLSDSEAAVACLTENLQRKDLNCFEQAEGIRRLICEFELTQQQAAVMLGLSQPSVANKLRLLKLSEEHRRQIIENGLTERHARTILSADESVRDEILAAAIEHKLTAEEIEKLIAEKANEQKRIRSYKKRATALGDVRLFFNTVEKAVRVMKLAGVNAQTERRQQDGCIEYVIKIPHKT